VIATFRSDGRPPQALVTGASSGIGAALARKLAAEGYEVYLAARRQAALDRVVETITGKGGVAHALRLDVLDADGTAARVLELDLAVGGLDLVVANAGVSGTLRPYKLDWPVVRDTLGVNLIGAAATLLPLVPRMLARKRGHLVGISSLAAELPLAMGAVYGGSKSGLTHMLLAIRPVLLRAGVGVTVVHPGFVRTEMTEGAKFPMPFIMDAPAAAVAIWHGIRRRQALVRFPWPMGLVLTLAKLLPRPVLDLLVIRFRL
jgi:short-subunit dehydrogenase